MRHTTVSSFVRKDFNIEYEKVNQNLIGQKIHDYCKQCKSIQILRIDEILDMKK